MEPGANIRVVIRIRPPSDPVNASAASSPWTATETCITQSLLVDGRCVPGQTFQFDRVYDAAVTETRIIFDQTTKDLIDGALEGINGTVFAYGQTSAGKTFTMQGPANNPGIIPLGLAYFFERLNEFKDSRHVVIRMSYLEVYNEVIGDLLVKENKNLKIHETLERGVFVGSLSEPLVSTLEEALELLKRGEEVRKIGTTIMNEYSSRSHTVLRVEIESKAVHIDPNLPTGTRTSILTFVDLAGSERSGQMGNEGARLKEGGHINKSLLSLTSVISKLAEVAPNSPSLLPNHIPYRDSKLTRILQPALGGNAKCIIICAVSPNLNFVDETLSTLKFASRAKAVKNRAIVNEVVKEEDVIRCFREQVECLKSELGCVRKRAADFETNLEMSKQTRMGFKEKVSGSVRNCFNFLTGFNQIFKDSVFIFEHVKSDNIAMIESSKLVIASILAENEANIKFALDEKKAIEADLMAEIKQVFKLSLRLSTPCQSCLKFRAEIFDLNESVHRLEGKLDNIPYNENAKLEEQIGQMKIQLNDRQADLNELLDKFMQSKKLSETQKFLAQKSDDLDKQNVIIKSMELEKSVLDDGINRLTAKLEESASVSNVEYQALTLKSNTLQLEVERLTKATSQHEDKLKEFALKEQIVNDSHRREIQVILDKLETVEREKTDLNINYSTLSSSLEHRECELKKQIDKLATDCQVFNNEIATLRPQLEEASNKLKDQVNINSAIRTQLESEHRRHIEHLEHQLAKMTEEGSNLRRTTDEASSMVELLRSSLKSRQDQHEQSLEDLAKARSEVAKLADMPAVSDSMEQENSLLKQRVHDLEKRLSTVPEEHGKAEMKLRVEIERVRETAAKDRKIAQLRIADLEERINEREVERDSETAKVKKLQDAIKQLSSEKNLVDKSLNNRLQADKQIDKEVDKKENKNAKKESECLQQ